MISETGPAGDDRINLKFARTDLGRLTKMLIDQVREATGGKCHYTGRNMKMAHAGMRVTTGEFNALVEDLVATLNHFKVGRAELDELVICLTRLSALFLSDGQLTRRADCAPAQAECHTATDRLQRPRRPF